jgi:hypothetical protein
MGGLDKTRLAPPVPDVLQQRLHLFSRIPPSTARYRHPTETTLSNSLNARAFAQDAQPNHVRPAARLRGAEQFHSSRSQ